MRRRLVATAAGAALALLLLVFARPVLPTGIGGQTMYLRVMGRSMLPGLVADDIVGVRAAPSYAVGDVVAYRNPDLGVVVHRIVATDGDRFVIKGDNNSSEDFYHPLPSDVVGVLTMRLPGAARFFSTSPAMLSAELGGLTLLAGLIAALRSRRRRRPASAGDRPHPFPQTVLVPICSLALVFVLLGAAGEVVGRMLPAATIAHDVTAVHHTGTFVYTAGTTADPARNGFPVFRSDGGAVAIRFDYQAAAPSPIADAHGSIAMDAQIQLTNGWQETTPITAAVPFTGTATSVTGTLELGPLWNQLDALAARTGVPWGLAKLVIAPQVHFVGTVSGAGVDDTVSQPFTFVLDQRGMRLDQPWAANRLQFSATTPLTQARTVPYALPVVGWTPGRVIVLSNVVLVLSTMVLAVASLWDAYLRRHRAVAWQHARLGHALARGTLASVGERHSVVELGTLHDLVGARGSEPVFLDESGPTPAYFVLRNDTAFLYRGDGQRDGPGDGEAAPDRPAEPERSLADRELAPISPAAAVVEPVTRIDAETTADAAAAAATADADAAGPDFDPGVIAAAVPRWLVPPHPAVRAPAAPHAVAPIEMRAREGAPEAAAVTVPSWLTPPAGARRWAAA